ncbi:NAD-dependent protein deacetylase sirtuin-3-like isoform X3 [Protopterus annectens]|uniref:NAD-dependent protein deacetylase sirtuin-3-like isoform X3 n=1 Tax=Protopterus annectens TaxID=7888 RepID=UPI001CFBEA63|nr:NAD-dependent protein deacetylase sirtuin-3-like isoform X3 [Protopterus annectens]
MSSSRTKTERGVKGLTAPKHSPHNPSIQSAPQLLMPSTNEIQESARKNLRDKPTPVASGKKGHASAKGHNQPGTQLAKQINKLTVSDQPNALSRKGYSPKTTPVPAVKEPLGRKAVFSRNRIVNLADIAALIQRNYCHNIVVMAGAGISTASGIPDFRTPGTGLYDNLQQYNIPYPEAIFDIDYFTCNPKPFFALAKEFYPGKNRPNYAHYFIRLLYEKDLLLRMYTQNIDGLERRAGIPPEKLVEAHGTFSSASCHLCYTPFPAKEAQETIINNKIPICKICSGVVKPDIVFFGEDLPKRFYSYSKDFTNADLLIVMGTSLELRLQPDCDAREQKSGIQENGSSKSQSSLPPPPPPEEMKSRVCIPKNGKTEQVTFPAVISTNRRHVKASATTRVFSRREMNNNASEESSSDTESTSSAQSST